MRHVAASIALCALLAACEREPQPTIVHASDAVPQRLSEWGVVLSDGKRLELNQAVIPYGLNTPLFSDYALKLRTVWLPPGSTAVYHETDELQFPVGTIISKTFHYEKSAEWGATRFSVVKDDRESSLAPAGALNLDTYVLIETRLLVRYADGWRAYPYVWNDEQDDAFLELAGDQRAIELVADDGAEKITYIVPDANQCAGCHTPNHSAKELRPLGPKAWQLNREYDWWGDADSQLSHWVAANVLQAFDATPPIGARWARPAEATPEQRAKAYLDSNCAHCHNEAGAADTSALHLSIDDAVDVHYGVCKTPVAVGRGSGDRPYDIYPGRPDDSILVYRMQHSDPAIAMPELGRASVHEEGVQAVSNWIAGMNGEC